MTTFCGYLKKILFSLWYYFAFLLLAQGASYAGVSDESRIQTLLNKPGDVVTLDNRKYHLTRSVVITKPVVFTGGDKTELVFEGTGYSGIVIQSDDVTIKNLRIVKKKNEGLPENIHFKKIPNKNGVKYSLRKNSGVYVNEHKNIAITGNSFKNWIGHGVLIWSSKKVVVEGNDFYSPYYLAYSADIQVKGRGKKWSENIEIKNNYANSNNRIGISVGNGGFVRNVLISKNYVGTLDTTDESVLLRNHGILVYYGASNMEDNTGILVENNTIDGTRHTGIYIGGGAEVTANNNRISRTGLNDGITISGGILIRNSITKAIVYKNTIDRYLGSHKERCAISTAGSRNGVISNLLITENIISNSTGGICVDNNVGIYVIENNELSHSKYYDFYLRSNRKSTNEFAIKLRNNQAVRGTGNQNPAVYMNLSTSGRVSMYCNRFNGGAESQKLLEKVKGNLSFYQNDVKNFAQFNNDIVSEVENNAECG